MNFIIDQRFANILTHFSLVFYINSSLAGRFSHSMPRRNIEIISKLLIDISNANAFYARNRAEAREGKAIFINIYFRLPLL
jgi:hypothetical protein